ncbi:hypothetical protein B0H14DRAFT_2921341, partial [Mycena olivaceomarginata]
DVLVEATPFCGIPNLAIASFTSAALPYTSCLPLPSSPTPSSRTLNCSLLIGSELGARLSRSIGRVSFSSDSFRAVGRSRTAGSGAAGAALPPRSRHCHPTRTGRLEANSRRVAALCSLLGSSRGRCAIAVMDAPDSRRRDTGDQTSVHRH